MSLDLTMLAAIGYDRGLKFDLEVSDYLPARVRGDIFRPVLSPTDSDRSAAGALE